MDLNVESYRKQFPSFNKIIQLSSCSQSAIHQDVKSSINAYIDSWENGGMDWVTWMTECEEARQNFAKLINAEVEEIAIVSSVSHAVSAIATSLRPKGLKNQIITTDIDFPCIGHVWLSQPELKTEFINSSNGIITLDQYEEAVNQNTIITSISHVSYYNGFKQDLNSISEIVHQKGSYLFVDAYQSAGQTTIDVKRDNIDFLTTGMQKYMLGIPGIAFLYVKREIAEQITPQITGWFGQENPFAFDIKNVEYAKGAKRYDTGTFPMLNGYAANGALKILLEIGVSNIQSYLEELSQYTLEYAQKCNLKHVSPTEVYQKGSNTAFLVNNASNIEQIMKQEGFIVSARNDVIRLAPHFYNTKDDLRMAMDCLKEVLTSTTATCK